LAFKNALIPRTTHPEFGPNFAHYTSWDLVQISQGNYKHVIPGMSAVNPPGGCTNGGRRHENFFEDNPPCVSGEPPTRERLRRCLWSTSKRCIRFALGSFRR